MSELKFRPAIFGVTYAFHDGEIKYIILKRKKHWIGWEFPKGKIERFEFKRWAVKREVREETGLKILRVRKFSEHGKYLYRRKLKDRPKYKGQTYHLFAVKTKFDKKITLDKTEHSGFKWMNFKEAEKKLTWQDQKKCLKIVNDWLKKNEKN